MQDEMNDLNKVKTIGTCTQPENIRIYSVDVEFIKPVRCKDCRYYDLAKNGFNGSCNRQYATFHADDFCSYGERNDE